MRRGSLLLAAAASVLLSGCLQEAASSPAENAEAGRDRAAYYGAALVNFALMNAQGRAEVAGGIIKPRDLDVGHVLCIRHDKAGAGYFITWINSARPDRFSLPALKNPAAMRAAIASRVGSANTGTTSAAGVIIRGGRPLELPEGCRVPTLPAGAPVVIVDVNVSTAQSVEESREERRTVSCPEGYVGTAVQVRRVVYKANGSVEQGPWEADDLGGCMLLNEVSAEQERKEVAAWSPSSENVEATAMDTALLEAQPRGCVRSTLTHRKGGAVQSEKVLDTCRAASLPERQAAPGQPGVPPIREYSYGPPPCPDNSGRLLAPAYAGMGGPATKEDITAALTPHIEYARAVPAHCPAVPVYGTIWWPYYQTFRADWNGRREWAVFTRRYHVMVNLYFEIAPQTAALTQRHSAPSDNTIYNTYVAWTDYQAFPTAFKSGAQQWMYVQMNPDLESFSVWSMNGRSYPNSIGPRVGPSVLWPLNGAPYPYPNSGPQPWGNTAEQQAYNSGLSYEAFGRERFRYHAAALVVDYPPLSE